MQKKVSKSHLKPRALEFLRGAQRTKRPLIITDCGHPVLKIVPYSEDPRKALKALQGSVLKYDKPTEHRFSRDRI